MFTRQQRNGHQVVVVQAKQRALERTRQAERMARGHQHVQQGHHVLHFATIHQANFFSHGGGNVQGTQRVLHGAQAGPLAGKHHEVFGLGTLGNLLGNPCCSLACL